MSRELDSQLIRDGTVNGGEMLRSAVLQLVLLASALVFFTAMALRMVNGEPPEQYLMLALLMVVLSDNTETRRDLMVTKAALRALNVEVPKENA